MALGALAHYRKLVHCEFPIFWSMEGTVQHLFLYAVNGRCQEEAALLAKDLGLCICHGC